MFGLFAMTVSETSKKSFSKVSDVNERLAAEDAASRDCSSIMHGNAGAQDSTSNDRIGAETMFAIM